MSQNNVTSFVEKVKSDPQLREKVQAICSSTSDELLTKAVALAKEEGFDVSIDEMKKAASVVNASTCIPWGL